MWNEKMCKDKGNGLNSNYNFVLNYHKGTCHKSLIIGFDNQHAQQVHLLKQFNQEYYDVIEAF